MVDFSPEYGPFARTLGRKFREVPWILVLFVALAAGVGMAMLYSAGNGHFRPWAEQQAIRFVIGFIVMLGAALIDLRRWYQLAYWAYLIALLLVAAVDLRGVAGMGAERWINLGVIQLQPSEPMNLAIVLALARYFHGLRNEGAPRIVQLIVPTVLVLVPTALVLKEPDLGTGLTLVMAGAAMFFLAGVRFRVLGAAAAGAAAVLPVAWHFLHGYQKQRILIFLHPAMDQRGAGWHILQSKIALGSGGMFGKGFLLGTQSHLDFLPERQTDFIFTMLAEEFGFIGGIALLVLYTLIILCGFAIALRSRNHFGRLLGLGIVAYFFLYASINMAMVMGIIPVVGIPLPLVSYGGTAMLTVMFGFGLLLSVSVHRDLRINRRGESQVV